MAPVAVVPVHLGVCKASGTGVRSCCVFQSCEAMPFQIHPHDLDCLNAKQLTVQTSHSFRLTGASCPAAQQVVRAPPSHGGKGSRNGDSWVVRQHIK